MSPKREDSPKPAPAAPREPRPGEVFTAIFQQAGFRGGFAIPEQPGIFDIFIPEEACGTALHGDQVRVKVTRPGRDRSPEGVVERVLRHANVRIVGRLRRSGKVSIVTPKNPKIRRLIRINRWFKEEEVPDGAWVIVEVQTWSSSAEEPLTGKLDEVLGVEGDKRLPILLLIREGGIRPDFPANVEREAEEIVKGPGPEAEARSERRRDFRGKRVVTIDPATAKDFDDAVSLESVSPEGWRIGVHIADVAHYVRPGGKIDAEGLDRATSIYPVDRVIPMLPEALSNGLCSLNPGVDRLTMSAVFDVSREGKVSRVELCESVIHSVRRFAYEEVQALFEAADGLPERFPVPEVAAEVKADLMEIRRASAALLAERTRRGSLDLDLPEVEVIFDAEGIVSDVRRKERLESHRLIEDLMIAANEAVARELTRAAAPMLYRIHEPPDEDKLAALAPVMGRFGIVLPKKGGVAHDRLAAALEQARKHPAGAIVQRLVLRSLKRACYQPANTGHFGLASECYAHFTSPIRRYPDLIVHRAVKALLAGPGALAEWRDSMGGPMEELGRHTSAREERAQRLEWDARKILTLEFMRRFTGDVFEGYIAGLTRRGFFVELIEYPAEGFVPIRTLADDFYHYDEDNFCFTGRKSGRVYGLAEKVKVQISRIDVLAGEMDFILVRKESRPDRAGGKGKGKGGDKNGGGGKGKERGPKSNRKGR